MPSTPRMHEVRSNSKGFRQRWNGQQWRRMCEIEGCDREAQRISLCARHQPQKQWRPKRHTSKMAAMLRAAGVEAGLVFPKYNPASASQTANTQRNPNYGSAFDKSDVTAQVVAAMLQAVDEEPSAYPKYNTGSAFETPYAYGSADFGTTNNSKSGKIEQVMSDSSSSTATTPSSPMQPSPPNSQLTAAILGYPPPQENVNWAPNYGSKLAAAMLQAVDEDGGSIFPSYNTASALNPPYTSGYGTPNYNSMIFNHSGMNTSQMGNLASPTSAALNSSLQAAAPTIHQMPPSLLNRPGLDFSSF